MEEALSDGQWVIVTLNKTDREFHHIFCEVIYSDLTEPVEKISELYFAGKTGRFKICICQTREQHNI